MKIITFSRILAGTMLLLVTTGGAAAADSKRILLIHSFAQNFSPWNEYEYHIRAELRRQLPEPLEIFEASLATARLADKALDDAFAQYLGALSTNYKPDLVVTIGAPAANFFLKVRQQLFPMVPMIFTGVEKRRVSLSDVTTNDAVVPSTVDHVGIVDHILRLLPATDHVAIVTGNSSNEKFWVESISNELKAFAGRVTFKWLNELPFEDMLKRAATLPPRSAILFIYLSVDAAGVSHEGKNVVNRLHAVANAPMFSWIDVDFGNGIVGGPLILPVEVARQVARVADGILGGETPSKIGIQQVGFGTPKYDWRELQRWDINESRLPPGSEIHFRDPTVWERYRAYILVICGVILAQAALIGWLIYEHRHRRLAEILARNSLSELTHMNRIATAGELSASLAHEINQPLAAIVASASAARRWLAREKPDINEARASLDGIVAAGHRASDIITSVRSMFKKDTTDKSAVDINKLIWTVLGLVYIDLRKHEIDLQTTLDDQIPPVLGNQVQLQQVLLNLIMNAIDSMRSVQPRVLSITSKLSGPDRVEVSIEDTGTGIDPANLAQIFKPLFTTKESGMGMGLAICHSIIEGHGGRIWGAPGPGRGSIFRFSLPKNGPPAA